MTLLAPAALLLALGIVPALAACARGERRASRARSLLGLHRPGRGRSAAAIAALSVAVGLVALAASRPVVRETHARYLRTDTEAIFALDISRSMLAAPSPAGPTRLVRAKQAALALRSAIPDVPAGVASFTDRTLPNLFPTSDETVFTATVDRSVGIERPPPGGSALTVTTLDALATIAQDAYFTPGRRRRLLVILTDAESRDFDAALLRKTLGQAPGLRTVLVRIGSSRERVFGPGGLPEADYHPENTAQTVRRFVEATGARAFGDGELGQAAAAVRDDVGRGASVRFGTTSTTTNVGPYLLLAALAPLGFLLGRRNLLWSGAPRRG